MEPKVVVITGASGGIGAALARRLARDGHSLALAARRARELREVAAACGPRAVAVVADVTRRADVERLRDEALAAHGRVDVWVNNAGRGIGRKVLELSDADLDEMFAVNVRSALYGMQAIVPYFQRRGSGHLVNVSSFLGRVPLVTFRSAYSAAKAALDVLTENLRADLLATHPGVQVSLVMPGVVTTAFRENALGGTPPVAPGSTGPPAQTPEQVADVVADAIAHPRLEVYTNPEPQKELLRAYYADVAAFQDRMAAARRA